MTRFAIKIHARARNNNNNNNIGGGRPDNNIYIYRRRFAPGGGVRAGARMCITLIHVREKTAPL